MEEIHTMLKKWNVTLPELTGDKERRAYIYLPDYYDIDESRRYPVMYMFDGHNVFVDEDATFGKSWGMKKYMDWTKKPLIIVAVECNHEGNYRLREYAPFDYENFEHGHIESMGKAYLEWMVNELKPYVDANYRTLPDRNNTIICGSSMGGLMAMYGVTEYNHVFQRAACLSPSLWVDPSQVIAMAARSDLKKDTCIYMDYGSNEVFNHHYTAETMITMSQLLLTKRANLAFRIVPGGDHSEASWEKQIPVFMDCLGL